MPHLALRAALVAGLALGAAVVFAACDALPGKPKPGAHDVLPSQVVAFDGLYARHCAGCHGVDGKLGAARPLNDPVYLALVPHERLRQVIARGVPGTSQPAFARTAGGDLTDAQIDALVQGLINTWGRPEVARDALLATHGGLSLELCAVLYHISPMALYRLVCALGQHRLVTVLTRCGLPLPAYFLADEKHRRCLTEKVYLPTIVRGRVIWHLGYIEEANRPSRQQRRGCVLHRQRPYHQHGWRRHDQLRQRRSLTVRSAGWQ